ncbi:MAG: primosomal protein N' (replication factor Y) - superfamily II helicase [Planctomycetes bacterium]|nr:primosomal protein N' (replication factor Y) - superfamily II helicase [Planctomycetota bacterium]
MPTQRADDAGAAERKAQNERFPCAGCAAPMRWDPDADALACDYCGARVPVPRGEGLIVERALADAGTAARGLGLETRVAGCANCGAQVAYDGRATAVECVFCGSPQVLEQASNRNALRPESLVPLDVGRETVERSFRAWLGGLWFRPDALKRLRDFRAVGVYVPFWTFDARVHSDWSADAGYYYYVQVPTMVMVNGKPQMQMRTERRVRWEPAWGARDDAYDDLLVHASRGLPVGLASKLGTYDLGKLVPYRPEYLAGWRAEEYAVDLATGWTAAQGRIVAAQESRCSGDVPGDTQRNLRVANRISDVRWKHVLLPLWSLTYSHGGKPYPVLIHGQTGRVVGEAPYSWVKILLFVLAVLAAVGAALLVLALLNAAS